MRSWSRAASLLVLIGIAVACPWRRPHERASASGRLELAPLEARGPAFARAKKVRDFHLPLDHGPHFAFETEWWYYTGNLAAGDGRRFGFQLTFFRRGLSPGAPPKGPGLRTNQVYFAHLALTDVAGKRHRFFERWSRGAAGLAGASGESFRVWLEDWRAEGLSPDGASVRLLARDEAWGLDLRLAAAKPLVRHGEGGLSPKSAVPGNASYYIGYTRMSALGSVSVGGPSVEVSGSAWFDHEWSTSALGEGAVGWDWFSLQLEDGRELMFFRIRRADGTIEPASGGTLVARDGSTRRLLAADVALDVLDRWTSPESGATYPVRWRLRSAAAALDLEVERRLNAQEMRASFTYWEGAVLVRGTSEGRPTGGEGYVELTGYAGGMKGVF
jgi:predicted secreted hydrolase